MQSFISEFLLAWVFSFRINNNQRGKLRHVIVLDEGKRVFDIKKERGLELPMISLLTSMVREFGEGLIVSDQEPSKIAESILANSYTKICMFLGDGKDLYIMGKAMNLTPDQIEACGHLEVGEAVVKIAGRYTSPFPVKMPDYPIQKDVSDEEIAERMNPILKELNLQVVKCNKKKNLSFKKTVGLSEEGLQMLNDILYKPFLPLTERTRNLKGISKRKADKVKRELIQLGLIEEVIAPGGGKGGQVKLLKITDKGASYLRIGNPYKGMGEGGFLHRYWQNVVKDYFKQKGYKVKIGEKLRNKIVDVGVLSPEGKRIAYEITLDLKNLFINIREDLRNEYDEVWLLFSSRKDLQKAKKLVKEGLSNKLLKRIHFAFLNDFRKRG